MSWGLLRDQGRGWHHLGVLLSLAYRLLRFLFSLLAVLVRSDLSKDIELLVLRHENQVLRRRHGHRPHQSRRQRPPGIETQPVRDVADLRSVRRKRVVAGVINEYHHAA